MDDRELMKNASGYSDPTAGNAIKNVEMDLSSQNDDERFFKLLHTIFDICDLSGFHVEGRITIVDKKTGRIWR